MKPQEKFRVFAEAPTIHQANSVRFFGLTKRGRKGLLTYDFFDTKEEAIDYLKQRVEFYAERNGTEDEIEAMLQECEDGFLKYDAVMAIVQEVEYYDDGEFHLI